MTIKEEKSSETSNQAVRFPRCERCGARLSAYNRSQRNDLCIDCFREMAKGGSSKRCIICREKIKEGERAVRQQVGSISGGEFANFETLWYQHGKCRKETKPKKVKNHKQG